MKYYDYFKRKKFRGRSSLNKRNLQSSKLYCDSLIICTISYVETTSTMSDIGLNISQLSILLQILRI